MAGKHRAASVPGVSLLDHVLALLEAADQRYRQWFAEKDLRDQQRFDAAERALQAALIAQERAVQAAQQAAATAATKAEIASEKRFDANNEFRGQLADQAATLMPRAEAEQRIGQLAEKIEELRSSIDTLRNGATGTQGRSAGLNAGWAYLVGAVALVGSVIAIVTTLH
jgi:hypothetical protein